ncbi:N-acetylmuramoyl-L-alanine amidase family protein [Carboxylicivirga sp. N1Y90]|uniref:N-acetylmuramoyl-L-alanine amidase family protein n=1 Tax=Carboxylicivirga fragile TaxID=3417571 RepID=UPI003D34943E|nr:N-acetylmuramoyl-L-alanine amidase [Marinilabiliaceae bacterium N1Y90]
MTIYPVYTRSFFIVLFSLFFLLPKGQLIAQESIRFKTVVIDAGHGGRDPGATGSKVKEKDVVLKVALKLGQYINEYLPDVKVVYTRDKDVFVPLNKRADIANRNNADLFVSIHANSIGASSIYGAETFVLGLHRSEENFEVAKKENSVIVLEEDYSTTYEGFDPNSSESYIIFELMQDVHLGQSISVASMMQDQFHNRVGRRDRGVKQAGFLVLRKASMPSVLVELGFLSNKKEEAFIASEKGQTFMASALFRAVRDYKNEFDSKSKMDDHVQLNRESEKQSISSIVYRIQIASSKKEVKKGTSFYKKFDNIWMYKDGDRFKYTTGQSDNYDDILQQMKTVKKDVNDCFVVAFENGSKIRLSEARAK